MQFYSNPQVLCNNYNNTNKTNNHNNNNNQYSNYRQTDTVDSYLIVIETTGVGGVRVPEGSSEGSSKDSSTRSSSWTTVTEMQK